MNDSVFRLESSLKPHALVQVTVPSVDNGLRRIPARQAVQMVFDIFLELCSGATALKGEGVWRNGDAPPVREAVSIVFGHLPDRLSDTARRRFVLRLKAFAEWARQDAVLVVVNNRAFLVKGVDAKEGRLATG